MRKESLDLIFFGLFNRFRQSAKADLDIDQYWRFLSLLMKGYGRDEKSMLSLCKALWLHDLELEGVFMEIFNEEYKKINESLPQLFNSPNPVLPNREPEGGKVPDVVESAKQPKKTISPSPIPKGPNVSPDRDKIDIEQAEILLHFSNKVGNKDFNAENNQIYERTSSQFIFSDDKHLPISPRKLGYALRKLKIHQQYELTDSVDISAMVSDHSRKAYTDRIQFKRNRKSVQKVILLINHDDSMVAYEPWADFLYSALSNSASVTHIERYFFYKYPSSSKDDIGLENFKLYNDKNYTSSNLLNRVLKGLNKKSSWLIIFSDAGGYENNIDPIALKSWEHFLELTNKHVSAITWINPLPKDRWDGTLAACLSHIIRMVPFNLEGVKQGIKWANYANKNRTS